MNNEKETKKPIITDTLEYVAVSQSGLIVRSFGMSHDNAQSYMATLPTDTGIKLFLRNTMYIEVPRGI